MMGQLRGGGRDKRRGGEEETEEVMVPLVFVSSIFLSGSLMHTHTLNVGVWGESGTK